VAVAVGEPPCGVLVEVGATVGVAAVGDGEGVAVADVLGAVLGTAQPVWVIVFVSRVTSPFRASARPTRFAPVCMVMLVSAMTVPTNVVPVASVAELPTCQYTWQGLAPRMSATVLLLAVMRVDPAWKMKTAFGSFSASRVSVPVSAMATFAL
jgi:hypothetical protein